MPAPYREDGARLMVRKCAKIQQSVPTARFFERFPTATMGDILILIPDKTYGNRALTGLLPICAIFGLIPFAKF
jgi:hypothetical protein